MRRGVYAVAGFILCCAAFSGCEPEIRVDNRSWGIRAVKEMAKEVDGLVEVQVDVRNVSIMTINFSYCFMWYDGAGFALAGHQPEWKTDVLKSGETKPLRATAPSPKAKKAGIAIRQKETFGSFE